MKEGKKKLPLFLLQRVEPEGGRKWSGGIKIRSGLHGRLGFGVSVWVGRKSQEQKRGKAKATREEERAEELRNRYSTHAWVDSLFRLQYPSWVQERVSFLFLIDVVFCVKRVGNGLDSKPLSAL